MSEKIAKMYGWRKVKDHDPRIDRWVHDCDFCGEPEVAIFRASPSYMGPLPSERRNHDDPFECIAYLRSQINQVIS